MTARYRIAHVSQYEYDRSVAASFNEARFTPAQLPWQTTLESNLQVDPSTWHYRFSDYWGTEVRVFEASGAHRALEVRATSLVEVDASRRPEPAELSWPDLRTPTVKDSFVEFLTGTPMTAPPIELSDLAESIAADNSPAATGRAICETVHGALTYLRGATGVHSLAADAWESRSGVCQDYAHLAVGALRHVGIPARYVSGYLHPSSEPAVGETARGESHAWVEWWLGEWTPYDPTGNCEVAERHVVVGSGRDYRDVPPIKGIVAGPHQTNSLTVTVDVTRLA